MQRPSKKLDFFLETLQEEFSAMEKHLSKLERHIPSGKHDMDRKTTRDSKLIKRSNLMVPVMVLEKNLEEHNDFI